MIHKHTKGFTLIELLVVMAIIGTLLAIVPIAYFHHIDHAKEVVANQDLITMRDAIDKFFADQNRYPDSIDELVEKHYLRSIPVDPFTDQTDSWVIVGPTGDQKGSVFDVENATLQEHASQN